MLNSGLRSPLTTMELTLFIPELIWPEAEDRATLEGLDCPSLARLLARGSLHRQAPASLEQSLISLWQMPGQASLAHLRLHGEPTGEMPPAPPGDRRWVCADPVNLRFHQERIVLGDGSTFSLSLAESLSIAETLNQEFADIGHFHVAHPQRWYLSLAREHTLSTAPLSQLAGRQLATNQMAAPHHGWLRRLQNEIQMLLHQHPVNQARENAGQPTVNGLWLWGDGQAEAAPGRGFDSVWCDHPLGRGLAHTGGAVSHPAAKDLAEILDRNCHQHTLAVVEDLLAPTLYEDGDQWRQTLAKLEQAWFSPLEKALAGGRLRQAHLITTGLHGHLAWHLKPADRWRFWKRPEPLSQLALRLAKTTP